MRKVHLAAVHEDPAAKQHYPQAPDSVHAAVFWPMTAAAAVRDIEYLVVRRY
jgi:hypothetical protein